MALLQKNESIELSRRRQRFNSHDTSYSSTNSQRIRINLDVAEEHIDFENSYLVFDMSVTGGTTDVGLNRYTASSWIKEIRIKDRAGNQIGENLQDYSVYVRKVYEMSATLDQEKSYLDALEGAQGVTLLAQGPTIAAKQYAHRIITHIPAMKNYFPARYLGGIQLEIDMNSSSDVILQTATESGATYTIENLAYACDLIKLKPSVEQSIANAVQNGLVIDYPSAHTVKGSIAATSFNRFDLGTMNGRVKNCFAVQIPTKATQAIDQNDNFAKNNTSNYRWKLGSRYLTESQIEVSSSRNAEYLMEFLKASKLSVEPYGLYGSETLIPSKLQSNKFVIGQNVDRSKTDEVLSSLKDKDNNRLELEIKYSPAAAVSTLYVFVNLDKRLRIMPGKQFVDDDFSGQGTIMAM